MNEPPHGLISSIAKLPDLGAIGLQASVDGPRSAEVTALSLTAGPARATANGTVDLIGQSADLDVTANAPAMTPAPGVSWQSIALEAHVHGPFTKPDASGQLQVAGLAAGGAAVAKLAAELHGNQGAAGLRATADGVRIPGPKPDLLAASPLVLQADVRLGRSGPPGYLHPVAPAFAGDRPRQHRRCDHGPCGPDRAGPCNRSPLPAGWICKAAPSSPWTRRSRAAPPP